MAIRVREIDIEKGPLKDMVEALENQDVSTQAKIIAGRVPTRRVRVMEDRFAAGEKARSYASYALFEAF